MGSRDVINYQQQHKQSHHNLLPGGQQLGVQGDQTVQRGVGEGELNEEPAETPTLRHHGQQGHREPCPGGQVVAP